MKKTLLAALIAATALVPPAFAQDRGGRWSGGRQGGASQHAEQQQRNWSRPAPAAQPQAQAQPQRQWNGGNRGDRAGQAQQAQPQRQWNGGERRRPDAQPQAQQQQFRGDGDRGNRGQWNGGQRQQGYAAPQQFRGGDRNDRNDRNRFDRGNPGWNNDRGSNRGWNGANAYRGDRNARWDNSWRNDRRYDWRGYRTQNRNLYRLPRYYAPSGWGYGYRRFSTGFQLSALLYSSQYWINDPFSYRLPEVDGPYRWVRYYNDALLVDVYSGQVVDTIYDIFW